jgi:hypothetical protein
MRRFYAQNFMTIGLAFEALSCKRTAGHTDRFYSVLTFWVHKNWFVLIEFLSNDCCNVYFLLNPGIPPRLFFIVFLFFSKKPSFPPRFYKIMVLDKNCDVVTLWPYGISSSQCSDICWEFLCFFSLSIEALCQWLFECSSSIVIIYLEIHLSSLVSCFFCFFVNKPDLLYLIFPRSSSTARRDINTHQYWWILMNEYTTKLSSVRNFQNLRAHTWEEVEGSTNSNPDQF